MSTVTVSFRQFAIKEGIRSHIYFIYMHTYTYTKYTYTYYTYIYIHIYIYTYIHVHTSDVTASLRLGIAVSHTASCDPPRSTTYLYSRRVGSVRKRGVSSKMTSQRHELAPPPPPPPTRVSVGALSGFQSPIYKYIYMYIHINMYTYIHIHI